MRNKISDLGFAGCVAAFFGWAIVIIPMSFWADRNLDFWLTHFKGEAIDCPFWLSFLASIFPPFSLILNIVGEIARLVV